MPIVVPAREGRVAEIRPTKEEETRIKQISSDDFFREIRRSSLYDRQESRESDRNSARETATEAG
jgi:hypothetical protein